MTEPPAYRLRRLANIEIRNVDLRQYLEATGDCVPLKVWATFETVEEKTRQAREVIATKDGERFVGTAGSLQAKFEHLYAVPGLKSAGGGWNTQHIHGAWKGDWHSDAIDYARTLLPKKRPLPHGVQSRIAEQVADQFEENFHTVRKMLRKSGIYN